MIFLIVLRNLTRYWICQDSGSLNDASRANSIYFLLEYCEFDIMVMKKDKNLSRSFQKS